MCVCLFTRSFATFTERKLKREEPGLTPPRKKHHLTLLAQVEFQAANISCVILGLYYFYGAGTDLKCLKRNGFFGHDFKE